MAENSKIEWCDHTFNPWVGCTKVSEGCKYCYAETLMDKRYGRVKWGPQGIRVRTNAANWRKPITWNRKAYREGRRLKVFCASLADVFEDKPDQPEMDEWRADLFQLIQETPRLDWLLLTKRPENVNKMIEHVTGFSDAEMWFHSAPHVWIGTSVENQEQADKRIPELLRIPAAVRFLSMEPLLGPVNLWSDANYTLSDGSIGSAFDWGKGVKWVIVGGESGTDARPMHPDWVRAIRDQCVDAGVPFFFKQWGEWLPNNQVWPANYEYKAGQLVKLWEPGKTGAHSRKIGKHAAGRLLDGRSWDGFPQAGGQR